MGILDRIMRGGARAKGNLCYKCGAPVVVQNMRMPIITDDIKRWANPLGGYCPHCQHYVCSKHTTWVKTDEVTYLSGCPKCKRELST
jgi:hypothetical protein